METNAKTIWKCWTCGKLVQAGDPSEFGREESYLCRDHPGGKSLRLAMADERRRAANERSYRTRGVSSRTYVDAMSKLEEPKTRAYLESIGMLKPDQKKDGEKS